MDPIVAFYRGEGVDAAGRRIDDVWSWDDDQLEETHDFIQWLFPLDVPSGANPSAPLLTSEALRTFEWDEVLRDRLRRSLDLMLRFYGFGTRMTPHGLVFVETPAFAARAVVWLHAGNHNHLRLTRILRSLSLLGFTEEARALLSALIAVHDRAGATGVSDVTIEYWRNAVRD